MREYAIVAAIAALVAYLTTPLARLLAVRFRAMALPRDRDVHSIPTPRWGGLAIFTGFAAATHVAANLPKMQGVFDEYGSDLAAVTRAGVIIMLIGVIDDRWGLDALTKFAGQVLAALVAVVGGVQLLYIPLPGASGVVLGPGYGVPLTILVFVITINAVNFIDGLDGLAAGVVAIAAMAFFGYAYALSAVHEPSVFGPSALICVMLAGACLGFLPHNFNPARIFMGDSGSMLIGLLLAAGTVTLTGTVDPSALRSTFQAMPATLPVLLPFAVLAVPFVDLLLAVFRRARARRSPFAPDKMHLHHRLLEIGHSQTRAVLIMYFWTALLGSTAVAATVNPTGPIVVMVFAAGAALLLILASSIPRLRAAHRR